MKALAFLSTSRPSECSDFIGTCSDTSVLQSRFGLLGVLAWQMAVTTDGGRSNPTWAANENCCLPRPQTNWGGFTRNPSLQSASLVIGHGTMSPPRVQASSIRKARRCFSPPSCHWSTEIQSINMLSNLNALFETQLPKRSKAQAGKQWCSGIRVTGFPTSHWDCHSL